MPCNIIPLNLCVTFYGNTRRGYIDMSALNSSTKELSDEFKDNIFVLLIAIFCNTNPEKAFKLYYNSKNKDIELTPSDCVHMLKLYERNVKVKDLSCIYGLSQPKIYACLSKVRQLQKALNL